MCINNKERYNRVPIEFLKSEVGLVSEKLGPFTYRTGGGMFSEY